MAGKLLGLIIIFSALAAGAALYYFQVYGFYYDVASRPGQDVVLLRAADAEPEAIPYSDFEAIDADSSPIRYRACFGTDLDLDTAAARYRQVESAKPRNAPDWFECFDASLLGQALNDGAARVFLSQKNVAYGVDRIVAITAYGRGYIWHELNDCGEKAYDGTVVGEECPPRPNQ